MFQTFDLRQSSMFYCTHTARMTSRILSLVLVFILTPSVPPTAKAAVFIPKTTASPLPGHLSPEESDGFRVRPGGPSARPTARSRIIYDFEDPNDVGWTTVNNLTAFYRQRADQHVNTRYHPRTDVTRGSSQGYYGYAFYDPHASDHYSLLYSGCQQPSGPACRLNFSAVIHSQASVHVATVLRCADCTYTPRARARFWAEEDLGSTSLTAEGKWVKQSINLGYHPVGFDISIMAYLVNPGEFIALDDIELVNCEPEPSQIADVQCPEDRPFRCTDTVTCLPLDRVCDQHADCLCEDDEWESTCEAIPPEGFLRLDTCSFESGNCSWYSSEAVSGDGAQVGGGSKTAQGLENDRGGGTKRSFTWEAALLPLSEEEHSIHAYGEAHWGLQSGYLRVELPPHSRAEVAILRSLAFQPRFAGDGQCQIRFWHRNTASESAVLKLELVELRHHVAYKPVRELWLSSTSTSASSSASASANSGRGAGGAATPGAKKRRAEDAKSSAADEEWIRSAVDLNNVAVNFSYLLQFKVSSSDLKTSGEVAVRNISLSVGCFYGVLSFESCGRTGPSGPSQEECDHFYGQRQFVIVRQNQDDPLNGAQSWTVPETMTYRVQALGSKGGAGVYSTTDMRKTRGASVTAKFALEKGDHLVFLVGQVGESACKIYRGPEQLLPPFCQSSRANVTVKGGGGGGGGATVVYRISGNTTTVMMVAGGGGGLPFISPDITLNTVGVSYYESSTVPYDLSTEGFPTLMTKDEADTFLVGSMKGRGPCSLSIHNNVSWATSGGFGRGGGACVAGGYGGGADFNADTSDPGLAEVGRPGRSYTHASALYSSVTPDVHTGSGFVEMVSVSECPCDYRCVWLGPEVDTPSCICPYGKRLSRNNTSCLDIFVQVDDEDHSKLLIPLIVGASTVIVLTIIFVCLYVKRYALRSRRPASGMEKIGTFLCPCLKFPRRSLGLSAHILPQLRHPPTVMRVNPNYDIVDAKPAQQGLVEIPRKNIKLTGELGQGAFGEVYSGLLSNVPMVDGDLPVAVKTLPPVCTEQTESDFHMEAVIVSQFNHPNIVKFIGVCFTHHPHYIVLELLEGGDLKTFLRAARPKQDQPSSLTVLDLLRLSLDVARGCQHLEEKRFIHRDIAARNCLLTTKGPNRTAKIADFGMARDIYRSDYYKKAGRAMLPVKWMPPEAFLDGVFTTKTDVWSFGILLWEVFSLGHMPYPGCSNEEVMTLVTQGGRLDPPDSCSLAVLSIMIACWSSVPEERPTFNSIISSLEKSLQSSRGLPVIYAPPTISAGGFRLHSGRPSPNSPFLGPGTVLGSDLSSDCSGSLGRRLPRTAGDGYLAPLLRSQQAHHQQTTRPSSGATGPQRTGFPHSLSACSKGRVQTSPFSPPASANTPTFHTSSQTSGGSNPTGAGGSVFLDCVGFSGSGSPQASRNRTLCKTPRIFYKPGAASATTNGDLSSDPASQALLHSSRGQGERCSSHHRNATQSKDSSGCERCHEDGEDEEENLKEGLCAGGASVALPPLERARSKKVCYTHLPRPSV